MPNARTERLDRTSSASSPEEDAPSLRRTFVILTFVAGCLLLPPRQWVSAAILFVLSGALLFRHFRVSAREQAALDETKRRATAAAAEALKEASAKVALEADASEEASTEAPPPESG